MPCPAEARQAILTYLAEYPNSYSGDVAKAIGMERWRVTSYLRSLKDQGHVECLIHCEKGGRNRYWRVAGEKSTVLTPRQHRDRTERSTLWLRIARWMLVNPGRSCADIAYGVGRTQNSVVGAMGRLSTLGMLWSRSEGNTKLWWVKDNYAVLAVRATEQERLDRAALKQRHQAEKAAARAKKEARLTSLRQAIQAERARRALEKQAREKEARAAWALEKQRQATQAAALKAAAAAQAKQERAEQQERAAHNRHGLTPEDAVWMAYYRTPRAQRQLLPKPVSPSD